MTARDRRVLIASGLVLFAAGAAVLVLHLVAPDVALRLPVHRPSAIVYALGALGWGIDRVIRAARREPRASYFHGRLGRGRFAVIAIYVAFVAGFLVMQVGAHAARSPLYAVVAVGVFALATLRGVAHVRERRARARAASGQSRPGP